MAHHYDIEVTSVYEGSEANGIESDTDPSNVRIVTEIQSPNDFKDGKIKPEARFIGGGVQTEARFKNGEIQDEAGFKNEEMQNGFKDGEVQNGFKDGDIKTETEFKNEESAMEDKSKDGQLEAEIKEANPKQGEEQPSATNLESTPKDNPPDKPPPQSTTASSTAAPFRPSPLKSQLSWDKQSYVEDANDETGEVLPAPKQHHERSREPPSSRKRHQNNVFDSPEILGLGNVIEEGSNEDDGEDDEIHPLDSVSQRAHSRTAAAPSESDKNGQQLRYEKRIKELERLLAEAKRDAAPRRRQSSDDHHPTAPSTDLGRSSSKRLRTPGEHRDKTPSQTPRLAPTSEQSRENFHFGFEPLPASLFDSPSRRGSYSWAPTRHNSLDDAGKEAEPGKSRVVRAVFTPGPASLVGAEPGHANHGVKKVDDGAKAVSERAKTAYGVSPVNDRFEIVNDWAKRVTDGTKSIRVKMVNNRAKATNDGAMAVNNGAKPVHDGVKPIKEGGKSVHDDAKTVNNRVDTADDGVKIGNGGAKTANDEVKTVNDEVKAVNGEVKAVNDEVKAGDQTASKETEVGKQGPVPPPKSKLPVPPPGPSMPIPPAEPTMPVPPQTIQNILDDNSLALIGQNGLYRDVYINPAALDRRISVPKEFVSHRALSRLQYPYNETDTNYIMPHMNPGKIAALLDLSLQYVDEDAVRPRPSLYGRRNATPFALHSKPSGSNGNGGWQQRDDMDKGQFHRGSASVGEQRRVRIREGRNVVTPGVESNHSNGSSYVSDEYSDEGSESDDDQEIQNNNLRPRSGNFHRGYPDHEYRNRRSRSPNYDEENQRGGPAEDELGSYYSDDHQHSEDGRRPYEDDNRSFEDGDQPPPEYHGRIYPQDVNRTHHPGYMQRYQSPHREANPESHNSVGRYHGPQGQSSYQRDHSDIFYNSRLGIDALPRQYPSFMPIISSASDDITVTVPLKRRVVQQFMAGTINFQDGGNFQGQQWVRDVWKQPNSKPDGTKISTEMLTVNSLLSVPECDGHQTNSITLTCANQTLVDMGVTSDNVQLRWMHISSEPSASTLESFVIGCPYISPKLKALGSILLKDAASRFRQRGNEGYMNPGAVLRYIGTYPNNDDMETEPVIFAMVPLIALQKPQLSVTSESATSIRQGSGLTRGLLHFLHGYPVGYRRECSQAIARSPASQSCDPKKKVLYIAQVWCMLLGPKTLITLGAMPLKEVLGPNICVDARLESARGAVIVRVDMNNLPSLVMAVPHSCALAAFLEVVLEKADISAEHWHLYILEKGQKGPILDAHKWMEMLNVQTGKNEIRLLLERERKLSWFRTPDGHYTRYFLPFSNKKHGLSEAQASGRALYGLPDNRVSKKTASNESNERVFNSRPPALTASRAYNMNDDDSETSSEPDNEGHVLPLDEYFPPGTVEYGGGTAERRHNRPEKFGPRAIGHQPLGLPNVNPQQPPNEAGVLVHYRDIGLPERPFLSWRIKDDDDIGDDNDDEGFEDDDTTCNISRLLHKIHGTSNTDFYKDFTGGLASRCTLQNVEARIGARNSGAGGSFFGPMPHSDDLSIPEAVITPQNTNARYYSHREGQEGGFPFGLGPVFGPLMRDLVVEVRKLISMFLPRYASPGLDIENEPVMRDIGGSMDRLIKNIHCRLYTANEKVEERWYVTDRPPHGRCRPCYDQYLWPTLPDALNHAHEHQRCPAKAVVDSVPNPADDPCYHKVRPMHQMMGPSMYHEVRGIVHAIEYMVGWMRQMSGLAMELHMMVKSPGELRSPRPLLPQSLVAAFKSIVAYIGMMSEGISSALNLDDRDVSVNRQGLKRLNVECRDALKSAIKYMRMAHGDILVIHATVQALPLVRFNSIGPEMLLAALVSGAQSRRLRLDSSSSSEPQTPSEFYQRYATELQFVADAKTSNRRVLVSVRESVRALEEEVAALQAVNTAYHSLWNGLRKVLDPASFRITNGARISRWQGVEESYIHSQISAFHTHDRDLGRIGQRTIWLKAEVKQRIDVLEERHGKAIRVFTIVTLLFLPLSFIASVFGMNTSDMRDMEFDQRAFWALAFPVTVVIVAVAYIYAYKMDDALEWTREKREKRKRVEAGKEQNGDDEWAKVQADLIEG